VRSISEWSVGIPTPENSIYKAYVSFIKESRHFIYIENQYFISSIDLPAPKNKIAEALYKRFVPIHPQSLSKHLHAP
jgi:phospholipase D1/2